MRIVPLALITAIIGMIALFFLAENLEPKMAAIYDLDKYRLGDFVRVSGEVTKIKIDSVSYFDLNDGADEVRVYSFDKLNLSNGELVEVIGKLDEYRGFTEIKAEQIRKISAED